MSRAGESVNPMLTAITVDLSKLARTGSFSLESRRICSVHLGCQFNPNTMAGVAGASASGSGHLRNPGLSRPVPARPCRLPRRIPRGASHNKLHPLGLYSKTMPYGSPRGEGCFLWARYPCTRNPTLSGTPSPFALIISLLSMLHTYM